MANIKTVKVESKHNITGRGTVWVINLEANGIDCEQKKWRDAGIHLYGLVKEKDGKIIYQIIGIEAFATHDGYCHKHIGLLIKKQTNGTLHIRP